MKYKHLYVNLKKNYSIGIDEETGSYVMETIIPAVAWYSRYFRISEEEFQCFNNGNREILNKLAISFVGSDGIEKNRNRFIRSDLKSEN